jgi:hypothetical protein
MQRLPGGLQGLERYSGGTGKLDAGPLHRERQISECIRQLYAGALLALRTSGVRAGLPAKRDYQT